MTPTEATSDPEARRAEGPSRLVGLTRNPPNGGRTAARQPNETLGSAAQTGGASGGGRLPRCLHEAREGLHVGVLHRRKQLQEAHCFPAGCLGSKVAV